MSNEQESTQDNNENENNSGNREYKSKWGFEENPKVDMAKSPFTAADDKDKRVPLFLLPVPISEFNKAFAKHGTITNDEMVETEWGRAIVLGTDAALNSNLFINAMEREGSDWKQYAEHEGLKISAGVGGYNTQPGSRLVAGAARNKFLQITKSGGESNGVMYHSGFKLSIKTPMDPDLNLLDSLLLANKNKLGYITQGMVFSRQDILLREEVYNFCKNHIVFSNIKDFVPEMLDELLLETDFFELVKTMADATYINGYKLAQPCVIDPSKCRHINEDLVTVRRMTWVDNSRFTPTMKKILSSETVTIEQIKQYQEEAGMTKGVSKVIKTSEDGTTPNITLVLNIPAMGAVIKAGKDWCDDIAAAIQQASNSATLSANARENLTRKQIIYSILREYSCYIKRIVYDDDSTVEGAEDIDSFLQMASGNEVVRNEIVRAMQEYYDETVLSIVGIPAFKCRGCQQVNTSDSVKHPYVIPVDALQLFFALKDRRLL